MPAYRLCVTHCGWVYWRTSAFASTGTFKDVGVHVLLLRHADSEWVGISAECSAGLKREVKCRDLAPVTPLAVSGLVSGLMATWFGGQPKQSYPGGKESAERAKTEGCRAVESSAFRQKIGTECDWMLRDIGVILLPPLGCSTESARTHGHGLCSPGPCFHCDHDMLLGVFTVCVHQHFRSRPQARQSPSHVKQGAETYREKCQAP